MLNKLMPNTYKDQFLPTKGAHRFRYDNPSSEHVDIEDIATSLSRLARFNGHTKFPYWVAVHAVDVSRLVPPSVALEALLHDASESYMGDVISPLKGYFKSIWVDIEHKVNAAILQYINERENFPPGRELKYLMNPWIHAADATALKTEAIALCSDDAHSWEHIKDINPENYPIIEYTCSEAYTLFMDRYNELVNLRKKT